MASSKWKSAEEIRESASGREIVFWGASHWVGRTQDLFQVKGSFIADNNPNNLGVRLFDLMIDSPRKLLLGNRHRYYVVITTGNYASVIDELGPMGYVQGDDYSCTPLLSPRRTTEEISHLDRTLLVTSPQHSTDSMSGGGLYLMNLAEGTVRKVLSGKCRGLAGMGDGYVLVDMLRGVLVLDNEFNEVALIPIEKNAEPHGICYDEARGMVVVGQPGRDSFGFYDCKSGKLENEIFVSDKWQTNKCDNHHVNDPFVVGDALFSSLFSITGNWMHQSYDGGVIEIDVATGKLRGPVVSGLWMPHSVCRFDGRLTVLDSMRGKIVSLNWRTTAGFSSFARGLDYDGKYYFVGLSEHRHPQMLSGQRDVISLDTGVAVFDPETSMSRFLPFANAKSIHSVVCVNKTVLKSDTE